MRLGFPFWILLLLFVWTLFACWFGWLTFISNMKFPDCYFFKKWQRLKAALIRLFPLDTRAQQNNIDRECVCVCAECPTQYPAEFVCVMDREKWRQTLKSGLDFIRSTPPGDFIIMWRVFPFHSRLTDNHASPLSVEHLSVGGVYSYLKKKMSKLHKRKIQTSGKNGVRKRADFCLFFTMKMKILSKMCGSCAYKCRPFLCFSRCVSKFCRVCSEPLVAGKNCSSAAFFFFKVTFPLFQPWLHTLKRKKANDLPLIRNVRKCRA